jgi:hypothetical protein
MDAEDLVTLYLDAHQMFGSISRCWEHPRISQ